MTKQQTLKKAIQKAIDGGWKNALEGYGDDILVYAMSGQIGEPYSAPSVEELIFNKDFAKALFGEKWLPITEGVQDGGQFSDFGSHERTKDWQEMLFSTWDYVMPAWAYHLCQMVVADDPIAYLGENIDG